MLFVGVDPKNADICLYYIAYNFLQLTWNIVIPFNIFFCNC